MKPIIVDQEILQEILKKLVALEKAEETDNDNPSKEWVDNQYLCQLLDVHKRTLQNYRDSGKLAFSQPEPSGKIYYRLSDVNAFLEAHYKPAFNISNLKKHQS